MQPTTFSPGFGPSVRPAPARKPVTAAQLAPPPSSYLTLCIVILVAELLNLQTRIFEFYLNGLRIPLVISVMLAAVLLFSLTTQSANLTKRTTGLIVLLFGWLSVSTLFSTWRSNSVTELSGYVFLAMVGVAIASMIDTPARFIRMLTIVGFLYGGTMTMGFLLAEPDAPRLQLLRGSYSDPNLYGLTVSTGIPIMWWLMKSGNLLLRLAAFAVSIGMYWVVLKTGSRGALIALIVMMVLAVFYAPPMRKVMIVVALALGVLGASLVLSTYAKKRLFTLFDSAKVSDEELQSMSGSERNSLSGDVGSSESRWQLLLDSLEITAKHPVLGVGPGNFGDARWGMHLARVGRNIAAQTTHNTYTQLSSEAGLLSLAIFLVQIFDAFRNLKFIRKWNSRDGYAPSPQLQQAAHYLRFVLFAQCVGMFFLSLAYNSPFCIIAGLTLALRNTVEKEWMRYRVALAAPETPQDPDMQNPRYGNPGYQNSGGRAFRTA